jgi:hypothetical protein
MTGEAAQTTDGLEVFSAPLGRAGPGRVEGPQRALRLYRAVISEHWMLGEGRDDARAPSRLRAAAGRS